MPEHILVPLDGSRIAETAVVHAAALARLFSARVTLARVPENMVVPVASGGVWITKVVESEDAALEAERYLTELCRSEHFEGIHVEWTTPEYPVVDGLVDAIGSSGADLVVMASHGRTGAGRWIFGSVARKLLRILPVPLYVVRAPEAAFEAADTFPLPGPPDYRHIVVPLDMSADAEVALEPALALARASGGQMHLVTVPTIPGYLKLVPETAGAIPDALMEAASESEAYLAGLLPRLDDSGVTTTADVELLFAGGVAEGILEHCAEHTADVVVLSTHGRGGLQRWLLGSVAERLLETSPIPVWLNRAEG